MRKYPPLVKTVYKDALEILRNYESMGREEWVTYVAAHPITDGYVLSQLLSLCGAERTSSAAKLAADARHSEPGGSRDVQAQMRAIWASGKYTSRERCAEKEHDALGISYSTARKALRNTPDLTRT